MNTNALDKRIFDREQYTSAKADVLGMNIFGDMYNMKHLIGSHLNVKQKLKSLTLKSMYDKYTDF